MSPSLDFAVQFDLRDRHSGDSPPLQTMRFANFSPAYGRVYNSKKALLTDMIEPKDFVINTPWGSTYTTVPELLHMEKGLVSIQVRYGKREENVTNFTRQELEKALKLQQKTS